MPGMSRPLISCYVATLVALSAVASPHISQAQTHCADETIMYQAMAPYQPPNLPIFTFHENPDLTRVPDALIDHISDFFALAFSRDVDPRLPVAFAFTESGLGSHPGSSGTGTQCERNNNPWSLEPCNCTKGQVVPFPNTLGYATCVTFDDIQSSIRAIVSDISKKLSRTCKIHDFVATQRCQYCTTGCSNWESNLLAMYSSENAYTEPFTQFLHFGGSCLFGDCNNDGQVTVDELVLIISIALGEADVGACIQGVSADYGYLPCDWSTFHVIGQPSGRWTLPL
jgi:hypothetical protein